MNYQEAKKILHQSKEMNPKEEYKQLSKIAHQLQLSSHPSIEEINFMSAIIAKAAKVKGFPGALLGSVTFFL